VGVSKTTVLDEDEILLELRVPRPAAGTKSTFLKFALRKSIDFPIVNCAAALTTTKGKVDAASICLNAVYVKPYRARKAEAAIMGKALNEANAEAAGEAAVSGARPRPDNGYMVQVAKVMVKRALLAFK
jgi:xanthine dehydrogenase YagS FAD-binding subunit